ncbi:PhoU-like phosphate uptake regulator [Sediminihabitans luteus]|uniref:Phosphate-specific transport system accessory protein PhoU n=1 Tax=Sediminihabitans luteus TaxID=1138585 RepID=A0A2M9CEC8_9CELL|nr:phosphate signaling complex protein PhoU [Sediminihabitans luteus]PJJ70222.1 PhoU-like phosphate uptake regulator [Sediminihabitans luteus]GII97693.1 phosphate transport system regulatory protein PhoU [Sediminihabitans luteus]
MREIFEAELKQVGDDLVEMSTLVVQAIDKAGRALLGANLALAQEVIVADQAIDSIEQDLDERCVLLLAQQAPVATDLRVVVSALRMSATLERMGDLARHIAEIARGRYPSPATPALRDTFEAMHEAATRAARRVEHVLTTHELEGAEEIERDDQVLDDLHQGTFAAMLGGTWEAGPQETVDVTLLSRYYERFGDHAVSIAHRVTFLVTGEFVNAAHSEPESGSND